MTLLDELAILIHGRMAIPQDYLGDQSARIFGDALAVIHAIRVGKQEAEYYLGELLACLHGDGGHYLDQHGTAKATMDAMAAYYGQIRALDELRVERDHYRAALGRIASQWAQPARDIARESLAEADKRKNP